MGMVPLDKLMEQHHREVTRRLDRLDRKVDKLADHEHPESVSWTNLVSTLIPLGGGLVALIFALS